MSRWADWFMISPEEADQLLSIYYDEDDQAVLEALQPWLDRLEELPLHVQMDKAWEPIHRCLTKDHTVGGLNFEAGEFPLSLCVLGGLQLLDEKTYRSASLVPADTVANVGAALASIDLAWLKKRFFCLPDHQFHEVDDQAFEWMWEHFKELPPFFDRAAKEGRAIICTISH
jgi:hypothetical protein